MSVLKHGFTDTIIEILDKNTHSRGMVIELSQLNKLIENFKGDSNVVMGCNGLVNAIRKAQLKLC